MKIHSLACLLALSLFLIGCGGDAEPTPTATATEPPPTATVTAPPEEPTQAPTLIPPSATPVTVIATPAPTSTADSGPNEATSAAMEALAGWLGPAGDPALISVASADPITWTNGCLDVARVGLACTEALVEGYRVILALGNATYEVRTDLTGAVAVWAPSLQILVQFREASTNLLTFMIDDGGELVAQAVPGTSFGVDVQSLSEGEPVGLGLAEAPQREGFLLVWVDPAQ